MTSYKDYARYYVKNCARQHDAAGRSVAPSVIFTFSAFG